MSAQPSVLPGAEPFSAPGGPHGVLVLHGFTGSPQSVRPLAEAFAAAGFAVELPRLPGHGTTVEDMLTTSWADWAAAAEAAYADLSARVDQVVVAGLSMGGTLTTHLAVRHPEIAGIVLVNPAVAYDAAAAEQLRPALEAGMTLVPGVGNDVADPDVRELAYDQVPLPGSLSLLEALRELEPRVPDVRCPVLLVVSKQDHVVPPASADGFAARVGGPVERLDLERSYHVATIDYDKDLIAERAVAFARRVTG